jgi:hypothetical protein
VDGVTYREFIEKAVELRKQAEAGFSFFHMLQEPLFAFLLGSFILCVFIFILVINFDKKTKQFSWILQRLYNENNHDHFPFLFLFLTGTLLASAIIFGHSWNNYQNKQANVNKEEINKYYQSYMKTQEDAKYPIAEMMTDHSKIVNLNSPTSRESYIFTDGVCSNCMIKEIAYRNEKKGDWQKATVILSYSLEQGEEPYMITKPQIREKVAHIKTNGLYNPVIFLSKKEGRDTP